MGLARQVAPADEPALGRIPEELAGPGAHLVGQFPEILRAQSRRGVGQGGVLAGGDPGLDLGHPADRVPLVDGRQRVIAAERDQVPVVVAHPESDAREQGAVRSAGQPAASVMADPGHAHPPEFADLEFAQRPFQRGPHPPQVLTQEIQVSRPGERVRAALEEVGVGDRVPRVDRREDRLDAQFGALRGREAQPQPCEQAPVALLAVERHVGEVRLRHVRARRKGRRARLIPALLAVVAPGQRRPRVLAQPERGPFHPGERRDHRAAAEGRRGDRDDFARGPQAQPVFRIDAERLRARDLEAGRVGERFQTKDLDRPSLLQRREVEALARALLPGRERPAVPVGHAAVLLHRDVALVIDAFAEQRRPVALRRRLGLPEQRVWHPAVPERALRVAAGAHRMERVDRLQRAHLRLLARNLERRGGRADDAAGREACDQALKHASLSWARPVVGKSPVAPWAQILRAWTSPAR